MSVFVGEDQRAYIQALESECIESHKPNKRTLLNELAYLAVEAYRLEHISRGRLLELAQLSEIFPASKLLDIANAACEA